MEPSAVYEATNEFLTDYPEIEDALTDLITLDERQETWTFDETELDSGRFGELVSRQIVKRIDNEYQLAHRKAVQAAINNEPLDSGHSETTMQFPTVPEPPDLSTLGGVLFALVVVVVGRAWTYNSVFQGDYMISPSNDAYFYRYWQAQLLEKSTGVTDVSVIASLPTGARSRPFTHAANWWLAELLGGTQGAADLVAAWLPVIGAIGLGIVIYAATVTLTDDTRIGVVAVTLLGLTPVHIVYTSLGFLEHRLHQYFWLSVMAFALIWLARESTRHTELGDDRVLINGYLSSPVTWVVAAILTISVIVSPYPWAGSTLVFVPLALYFTVRAIADVQKGVSPVLANLPVIVAVTVGSLVALYPHVQWGWHQSTAFLAYTPVLVAGGIVTIASVGEVWHRLGLPTSVLAGIEAVTAIIIFRLFTQFRPDQVGRIRSRIDSLLYRETAVETASLFSDVIVGPLSQLGATFYLAVIPLGLMSWAMVRRYRPEWLVPAVFGWWFLLIAAIQVRFAAHLSMFLCIFGAITIVYLFAAIDLISQPSVFATDSRRDQSAEKRLISSENSSTDADERVIDRVKSDPRLLAYGLGIGMLILSSNFIFAPSLLYQTTYSDAEVGAVAEIETHATAADREYPDNFVLSRWGKNRMYNYFVNGEARSYGFARGNFEQFLLSPDPDEQYQRLGGRTGYVVVPGNPVAENTTHEILYTDLGAGENATAHYQLLYAEDEIRVFALVEGAIITTSVGSGENVSVSTEVRTADQRFEYSRTATADETGTISVRVAYPGEYEVGDQTITVTDSEVRNGTAVADPSTSE